MNICIPFDASILTPPPAFERTDPFRAGTSITIRAYWLAPRFGLLVNQTGRFDVHFDLLISPAFLVRRLVGSSESRSGRRFPGRTVYSPDDSFRRNHPPLVA